MLAPIEVRLLDAKDRRGQDQAADWWLDLRPKRRLPARPVARPRFARPRFARMVGLALIRLGERLAEPAPRPARAR